MHQISPSELQELGNRFNISLSEEELDELHKKVTSNLEEVQEVWDKGQAPRGTISATRSWKEPPENPYNALITECEVSSTDSGPLAGVSVGLKDIIAVAGVPMSGASGAMHGFVPPVDSIVAERLLEAGATITAKTNLDEFAGGARGVSFYGQMIHPDDSNRIPGGSSGGSAIAVREGLVDVALGTDTGGSVRMPSAHCGIVGLKPTYGLVPTAGVLENTYSLDHVGPMTNNVVDCARLLDTIAGKDSQDPSSMQAAGRDDYQVGGYTDAVENPPDIEDITVGLLEEGIGQGHAEQDVRDEIIDVTIEAKEAFQEKGGNVINVNIDKYEISGPLKYTISYVELAAHWRAGGAIYRQRGTIDSGYQHAIAAHMNTYSNEVNRYYLARLLAGAYIIEEDFGLDYARAQELRDVLRKEFESALEQVDVLITPTLPILPPLLEEAENPGYNYSRNTHPANVTGLPAITIPNNEVNDLPVGLQLIGDSFEEQTLLGISEQFYQMIQ